MPPSGHHASGTTASPVVNWTAFASRFYQSRFPTKGRVHFIRNGTTQEIVHEYRILCVMPWAIPLHPPRRAWRLAEWISSRYGRVQSSLMIMYWRSSALCLVAENEQSLEITEVANLPDIEHDVDVDISLAEPPRIETITICRSSSSVNVESPYYGPAFCFHDWCYSILIWKLGCHPPKSIIYKLVRTIIPKSSTRQNIREASYQLDPIGTL